MPPRRRKRSRARRRRSGISKPLLLGGLVAVPVILLLGIYFLVWPLISGLSLPGGSKPSLSNTEILIDRSLLMNQPYWGGRSKLKFAQQVLGGEILSQPSSKDASWAIRQFGGPCDGDNTSLVTPFSPGNIGEAKAGLGAVELGGEASFTQGMTAAIEDRSYLAARSIP